MKDINCFKIADKYLFTGENDGSAHMYLIEKGEERRNFNVPQFNSPVSVIENNNADYLLVGYYDGTINLFDINKGNLMHSIKEIHKTKIIALKFANVEKNSFTFISTDEEGQVMDITYSSKLKNLKKNTSNELIFKDTEAVYAITKFKPNTDENKSLLGFSSANKVRLYTLEPKLELIFELNKPDYIEENDIPDISLGWGNRPQPKSTKKKLSEGIANKEIFFAVAWGHVISFYVITSKGDKYIPEGPIGYFENNISIIRLGFISASIIYFLTKRPN
jgi:WD40 repeat protein